MKLRSPRAASNLSDPEGSLTLDSYTASCGNHLPKPIPLERFLDYGKWFQRQAIPDVDRRRIVAVHREGTDFRLRLDSGEDLKARRVVVAAGLGYFAHIPEEFRQLPPQLRTHTSEHRDLGCFAGRRVIVIGAGQSALESAAILHEAGAEVHIIARQHAIRFLLRSNKLHELGIISRLLYSSADVGPAGVSRLVAAPDLYRRLPRLLHDKWRRRSVRPAGSSWLAPRLQGVKITVGAGIVAARTRGGALELTLDDASTRCADHVLLATGYRVDIERYDFLSDALLETVTRVGGFPRLSRGMEASSAPGLHFLGAPAAWTYGPLMQFVAGADFAARGLARLLAGTREDTQCMH
jgi:cation diffusion facilitator CzcD-associated flavoprotein CzcO